MGITYGDNECMNGYGHSPAPIAAYMKRHGLSQKAFARAMGVSQSAVSQWLREEKGISMKTAGKMERRSDREITVRALFPKLFEKTA